MKPPCRGGLWVAQGKGRNSLSRKSGTGTLGKKMLVQFRAGAVSEFGEFLASPAIRNVDFLERI